MCVSVCSLTYYDVIFLEGALPIFQPLLRTHTLPQLPLIFQHILSPQPTDAFHMDLTLDRSAILRPMRLCSRLETLIAAHTHSALQDESTARAQCQLLISCRERWRVVLQRIDHRPAMRNAKVALLCGVYIPQIRRRPTSKQQQKKKSSSSVADGALQTAFAENRLFDRNVLPLIFDFL